MNYSIGQIVCLWEVKDLSPGETAIVVAREILVRITEIKEGVPGEFTRRPAGTGLKGIGDDGKEYVKHWDSYPESQTCTFAVEWSMREDGTTDKDFPYWIPRESAPFHSEVYRENTRGGKQLKLVDLKGNPVEPKGDLEKCHEHGTFHYLAAKCSHCRLAEAIARNRQQQTA